MINHNNLKAVSCENLFKNTKKFRSPPSGPPRAQASAKNAPARAISLRSYAEYGILYRQTKIRGRIPRRAKE